MTQCQYYTLYDNQAGTCSEWANKLDRVYREVVNNQNTLGGPGLNSTVNQQLFNRITDREQVPEDIPESVKRKMTKAEKARQALGLPAVCPHNPLPDQSICIFHLDPKEYETNGVTSQKVCEAFRSAIGRHEQGDAESFQKCFAGARFREFDFAHQTLSSADTRPIELYLAEIDIIRLDDAVIDEHVIFDHSEIGRISCPNTQFRHAVSYKNTSIEGESISFENALFNDEFSFKNADLLFESITFHNSEFRETASFENVTFGVDFARLDPGTDPVVFNRAVFQDRVSFSKSKFEPGSDGEDWGLNEVNIKFRDCNFNSESDFNRCEMGNVAASGLGRVYKKDDTEELEWNITFKGSVFGGGFNINDCQISGDLTMEYVSCSGGDCRFEGLTIGGGLHFNDTDFGNKNIRFNRTTVRGEEVNFTGASFGKGKLGFDGMTANCHTDFTQTSYAGREVSFEEFSAESVTFQGAVFDISGGFINFEMDITGSVIFSQAEIFANRIDFSKTTVRHQDNDGHRDTDEQVMSFEGATIKGRNIDFSGMDIGIPLFYSHCDFEADELSFADINVRGSVVFRHSVFDASEADFSSCHVTDATVFDMSYSRFVTDKVKFEGMNLVCQDTISFANCTFRGEITFDESDLDCPDINLTRVNGEQATLDFRWVASNGVVVDMNDSILTGGEFIIGNCDTIYRFENATIGDIEIKTTEDSKSADHKLFEYFIIKNTTFDGFDFSNENVKKELKKTGWNIHTTYNDRGDAADKTLFNHIGNRIKKYTRLITEGPDRDSDPNELEVTYMKAKNGAKQKGDPEAVSQFFQKELTFRRLSHGYEFWSRAETGTSRYDRLVQKSNHLQNWLSNTTLWLSVGYGEHPRNVVLTSVTVIMVFAVVYRAINALPTASSDIEYLTYSFQGFIQLIVGISPTSSVIVRFLTAVEGFIGAFVIALFVITLTRSINR